MRNNDFIKKYDNNLLNLSSDFNSINMWVQYVSSIMIAIATYQFLQTKGEFHEEKN